MKMPRNSRSWNSSSTNVILICLAIVFYASIDNRLGYREKKLNLFDSFDGPFKENNELFAAERIFVGSLPGPESVASYKGKFYTGTADGRIVRLEGSSRLSNVIRIGAESCEGKINSKVCGRPLGVRVTSSGDLYTVDAFNGLVKVTNIDSTVNKPQHKLLFNISQPVDGNASVFLDDLVVDEQPGNNNVIYMTDASRVWDLHHAVALIMSFDDSGRILRYTESTGSVDVVLDQLAFPNGIELTDSKDALLIGEFTHHRILKHYLTGPKKGETEVLIDLPGEPDNVRRSARTDQETYWIAISAPRTKSKPLSYDYYSDKPWRRIFMLTFYNMVGSILEIIGSFATSEKLQNLGESLQFHQPYWETHHTSMVIEINAVGKVINCLHSIDGYIHSLSEVHDVIKENGERILYLASYANNFLGELVLNRK